MKFEKGKNVKVKNPDNDEVYKIVELFQERGISPDLLNVNIQAIMTSETRTVQRKDLRPLNDEEQKKLSAWQRTQRSPSSSKPNNLPRSRHGPHIATTRQETQVQSEGTPVHTVEGTVLSPLGEQSNEELNTENAALGQNWEATPNAPSSNKPVEEKDQKSPFSVFDDIRRMFDIGQDKMLDRVEQLLDNVLIKRDNELRTLPPVYTSLLKIVKDLPEQMEKPHSSFDFSGGSVADVQRLLPALQSGIKALHSKVEGRDQALRKITDERNGLKEERQSLQSKINLLSGNLERAEGQTAQIENALADETQRSQAEKEKLQADFDHATQATEAKKEAAVTARQDDQEQVTKALEDFWRLREDFYDGLHRGIVQHQGKNSDRFRDAVEYREESLKSDLELLKKLGCQINEEFEVKALSFGQCEYDGATHRPFSEDEGEIRHGEHATVLLPGWTYSDNKITIKPMLGRQEIKK